MNEFNDNRQVYSDSIRGTYVIFPLKYESSLNLTELTIDGVENADFSSYDMSDILARRCRKENGFVRRYILNSCIDDVHFSDGKILAVNEGQLYVFNNKIAFFTVLVTYDNADAGYIDKLINPGYVQNYNRSFEENVIKAVSNISIGGVSNIFRLYVDDMKLAVKETYLFNVALVRRRFNELKTIERITFNEHKLIDISRDFSDPSEKDVAYTYGAKDTNMCSYRWGACITSQSISYVYATDDMTAANVAEQSRDDVFLTMLVLHQKSTCMLVNEGIQNTLIDNKRQSLKYFRKVKMLKKEALEFRASGTLASSQVSRWNNVCETYRCLLAVNGIDEALEEIEQKVELIRDEQERKSSDMQNYVATVIAVFGLISIVASVLSIVVLVNSGSTDIVAALGVSCIGVVLFVFSWLILMLKK